DSRERGSAAPEAAVPRGRHPRGRRFTGSVRKPAQAPRMCPTPPDEAAAPTRSKRRRSPVPRRDSGQDGIPMTVKQTESKRSRSNEYAHLAPLFDELVGLERGDPRHAEVRECLVTGYLPLAEHIAQRFSGKGIAKEDLVQVASVGLI